MIYITGDTHGFISRFTKYKPDFIDNETWAESEKPPFIQDETWTENDVLIICGDFGFIFRDNPIEELKLDFLEKKKYTICFIDGNHDNFHKIFKYPETIWCGGKVHRIRNNVYHLMRGQVFEIQGKRFFTFGGAFSIDRASKGEFWWENEIPSIEEYNEGTKNLKSCNYEIDYCITHTAPSFIILKLGYNPNAYEDRWLLNYLFEQVYKNCKESLKCWFFGHFHEDKELFGDTFRCLQNDVIKIE